MKILLCAAPTAKLLEVKLIMYNYDVVHPLGVEYFDIHSHLPRVLDGLKLKEEDLRNKKILEVGSGQAYVAEEAKEKGIDILSFDFVYGTAKGRRIFQEYSHTQHKYIPIKDPNSVGGVAESLPFADEVFDFVLAYSSVPKFSNSIEVAEAAIDEMIRVLKPGGELRIFPFFIDPNLSNEVRQGRGFEAQRVLFKRFDENEGVIQEALNDHEKKAIQKLSQSHNLIVTLTNPEGIKRALLIVKKNLAS